VSGRLWSERTHGIDKNPPQSVCFLEVDEVVDARFRPTASDRKTPLLTQDEIAFVTYLKDLRRLVAP
jgi:hypothetical protein